MVKIEEGILVQWVWYSIIGICKYGVQQQWNYTSVFMKKKIIT